MTYGKIASACVLAWVVGACKPATENADKAETAGPPPQMAAVASPPAPTVSPPASPPGWTPAAAPECACPEVDRSAQASAPTRSARARADEVRARTTRAGHSRSRPHETARRPQRELAGGPDREGRHARRSDRNVYGQPHDLGGYSAGDTRTVHVARQQRYEAHSYESAAYAVEHTASGQVMVEEHAGFAHGYAPPPQPHHGGYGYAGHGYSAAPGYGVSRGPQGDGYRSHPWAWVR